MNEQLKNPAAENQNTRLKLKVHRCQYTFYFSYCQQSQSNDCFLSTVCVQKVTSHYNQIHDSKPFTAQPTFAWLQRTEGQTVATPVSGCHAVRNSFPVDREIFLERFTKCLNQA